MRDIFKEHEEYMKKGQEIVEIQKNLETASPEQLKKLFDEFDLSYYNSHEPNMASSYGSYRQYTLLNDENGKLKFIAAKLNDGTGLAILKTTNGFSIARGKIMEARNNLFNVHGNEISDYDENLNLLKQTVYEPDDSYRVQKFEDGKLKSTSFYDKDNNLLKRVNKKGDAERRTTSDALDALNEMAPSGLRQRLKRVMVKEYRQTHPKTKQGSGR